MFDLMIGAMQRGYEKEKSEYEESDDELAHDEMGSQESHRTATRRCQRD
jgi:hypothetical protein